MIILLYGPDTYRSRLKLNEIIDKYKTGKKKGFNATPYFIDAPEYKSVKDELKQSSMFRQKKLLVLTGAFEDTNFKDSFIKDGKFIMELDDVVVFYQDSKINKRDKLLSFLIKRAKVQEFELFGESKLRFWVKKKVQALGADIDNRALEKLILYVGNDLWSMNNEIEKLASYKNLRNISSEDVDKLVKTRIETDIFKTIDAIAARDKKKALFLLRQHLKSGDAPFYLFSMINFQFRNLLAVKDLLERNVSPFSAKNIHPFVIRKSMGLCSKFSFPELKKIYQQLSEIDFKIKVGRLDAETALDILVTAI